MIKLHVAITTSLGGDSNQGLVYKINANGAEQPSTLSPAAPTGYPGRRDPSSTTLHSFNGPPDGQEPVSGVVLR